MKKTTISKRIAAAVIAIAMLLVFSSCGGNNNEATTTTGTNGQTQAPIDGNITTPAGETSPIETETVLAPVTQAPAATDAQQTPVTSTPQQAPQETAAPAPSNLPTSVADITAYFVNALNDVKNNAASVTKTYDCTSNYKGVLEGAGALESTAKWLMEKALKPKEPNEVHTGKDDIIASFPPAGASSSALTADKVRTATFTDRGTYYEIYILLNNTEEAPDKNPPECGGYAGSIGTVMRAEWVSDAAGDYINFNQIDCSYVDSAVTAKFDKSTGRMTDIHTDLPCYLVFDEISTKTGLIKTTNAKIGLEFEQKWTVQW